MNHQSLDASSIYHGNVAVHKGSFRPNTTIVVQSSISPIDRYFRKIINEEIAKLNEL
jgi:hypothetical protein